MIPLIIYRQEAPKGISEANKIRTNLFRLCEDLAHGKWTMADVSGMHEFIGVCLVLAEESHNASFTAGACRVGTALEGIILRYGKTGRFVATGDELTTLRSDCDAMAEAMGDLPDTTVRIALSKHIERVTHAAGLQRNLRTDRAGRNRKHQLHKRKR